MENMNEVMYEENYGTEVVTTNQNSESKFGKGVLFGTLVTLAGVAIVKGVKKGYNYLKTKKEGIAVEAEFKDTNA